MMRRSIVILIFVFIISSEAFDLLSLDNCGQTKGCLRPAVCEESYCQYAATWRRVKNENVEYIEFELSGIIYSNMGFISLSFSKYRRTGGYGIVGCYPRHSGNKVEIRTAYRKDTNSVNEFYDERKSENLLVYDQPNLGGVYDKETTLITCRFWRRVTPIQKVDELMDLASPNMYYLLINLGKDIKNTAFEFSLSDVEIISNESIVITSPMYGNLVNAQLQPHPAAKAHVCLMILAWIFCASLGVILSRYYKEMWPNSGLLGERVWFQAHRILMGICVFLTALAVIIGFAFYDVYISTSIYPDYIHPILDVIVLVLALLNPLISFCRCHPISPRRPWFNWIHFFIGSIAHCLSIPTIMLGLRMPAAGLTLRNLNYPMWMIIFFVIFQFIVEITLEIHGCMYYRRNKNKRHAFEADTLQYQNAIRAGSGPIARPLEPEPSGRIFKLFMIGLHSTVAAMVSIILIITVILN